MLGKLVVSARSGTCPGSWLSDYRIQGSPLVLFRPSPLPRRWIIRYLPRLFRDDFTAHWAPDPAVIVYIKKAISNDAVPATRALHWMVYYAVVIEWFWHLCFMSRRRVHRLFGSLLCLLMATGSCVYSQAPGDYPNILNWSPVPELHFSKLHWRQRH